MNLRIQQPETEYPWLEVMLNTLSEGVLVMDEGLILRLVNPKAQGIFGMDPSFPGISLLEATRSPELETAAYQVLKHKRPIELELKRYTSGEPHYFQVCAAPFNQSQGEPEGILMVLTDSTRLHKLEQVRKDFAANVSHELRTPIQLVKGFAETLLGSPLEDREQLRHFIGIILKNAQTMENLTTDLLSLVSLEEGTFPFDMKETPLYPLLQEACTGVDLAAQKKEITLSLACPLELKAVLYGPLIIQGVINLLDNAVKYSPPGSRVRVEAALYPKELIITVEDEGMGIPPRHLERIFERFYRVDHARGRGGTGLGLAIVRHIALVHQGTAEAESHAGEGSIFRIRIPVRPLDR